VLLVMALGAAMLVGNIGALVRPRRQRKGELRRAPMRRTLGMATIGAFAMLWSIATLVTRS
jgi:hypothetical protein